MIASRALATSIFMCGSSSSPEVVMLLAKLPVLELPAPKEADSAEDTIVALLPVGDAIVDGAVLPLGDKPMKP